MGSEQSTRRQSGFTLVELLIVAIILAILAAIIIPQFASTTTDAQESALRADAAGLRAAMALYRQQHGEYPGELPSNAGACAGGAVGTGAIHTEQAIIDQLTRYSNDAGDTCTIPVAGALTFPYGPYVQGDTLPTNPITGSSAFAVIFTGSLAVTADGAGLGWKFDTLSGKLIINDTNLDSAGVAYSTY